MGIGRHVLGQDALSDTVANGVARRIPAVIGGQAVHHLILIEAVDQGVVGTVGKGHVDDADGDAEVDGLLICVRKSRVDWSMIGKFSKLADSVVDVVSGVLTASNRSGRSLSTIVPPMASTWDAMVLPMAWPS